MANFGPSTTGEEVVKALANEVVGKTILITGPSPGSVGAQAAIDLASGAPKQLVLAGRNRNKVQPVIDQINQINPGIIVTFVNLELADQASVRQAAEEINRQVEKLDIVINNAGMMWLKNLKLNNAGIEIQLAVNQIGHFLLTNLVMDKIIAAGPGSRVISVTSIGYVSGPINYDDPNFKNTPYNGWVAYGQSKTANMLFGFALARKLKKKGVLAFSVTPGFVFESGFGNGVTEEEWKEGSETWIKSQGDDEAPPGATEVVTLPVGSAQYLFAALSPSLRDYSGSFIQRCAIATQIKPFAKGAENEEKLWKLSEDLAGQKFTYDG